MRSLPATLALTLLALPAAGQALRPAVNQLTPPPGYSGFTAAPVPAFLTPERPPIYRAGTLTASGGPVNAVPFSGIPYSAFPHNGGQISPAMQDTSSAWEVIPDLSK